MAPRSILQIVSGFKPSVDGMGDFARRLGAVLWSQHSIQRTGAEHCARLVDRFPAMAEARPAREGTSEGTLTAEENMCAKSEQVHFFLELPYMLLPVHNSPSGCEAGHNLPLSCISRYGPRRRCR